MENPDQTFFKNPRLFQKTQTFSKNPDFFKKPRLFKKPGLFQKTETFSKNPDFSKTRDFFKNPRLFQKTQAFSKNRDFSKTRDFFKKPGLFQKTQTFLNYKKGILLFFLSDIMATNTLGQFSDGEDDFVFEIDEGVWDNLEDDDDDDDLIRSIDEDEALNQVRSVQSDENVWNNGEEDDDLIRSIDEDEALNQAGRGEKRKSDDQDEELGQYYYEIQTVRKHHSKKFGMTATDHTVRFNNVLHDVDLLESQAYSCHFPSLNRGCNLGHEPE